MNGTCHKIAGISTGVVVAHLLYPEFSFTPLVITTLASEFGSLFPDIDEPNSIVGKKIRLISKTCKRFLGHRGIIHTPYFLAIISVLAWFVFNKYIHWKYSDLAMIGFIAGYISHLLLDMLTPMGIMVFYPFTKKRFRILSLRGEYRDLIVSIIIIFGLIVFLLFHYGIISFNSQQITSIFNQIFKQINS